MSRAVASIFSVIVVVVAGGGVGCVAECSENGDCNDGQSCIQGLCDVLPANARIILPAAPDVGERFTIGVEVGFQGGEAIVTVSPTPGDSGDSCVPFPEVTRRLTGDTGRFTQQVVTVSDLPSLGPRFGITVRVDVNGKTLFDRVVLAGPEVEDSGIRLAAPLGGPIDIKDAPFTEVLIDNIIANAVAYAEPTNDVGAPVGESTARVSLQTEDGKMAGVVPALRGPHVVWVESFQDGARRRCGRAMRGGPDEYEARDLEVAVLSHSVDGDDHLVESIVRVEHGGVAVFCDRRQASPREGPVSCRDRLQSVAGADGHDLIVVSLDDGIVDIAAVPRQVSGPVSVSIRVSRGNEHLAVFGPMVLQPQQGESWLAGQIAIIDGEVVSVVADDVGPIPGFPF